MVAWARGAAARRWTGLRVGARSIKIVQIEESAGGLRLVKHLVQEMPVRAGGSVDQSGWLQTALKEFEAEEVHVCVSGPEVALRRVQVPPMPKNELAEGVRWAVKEHVAFPVQDAVVDFQVIGEVWDKDIKKQDALVAVASRAALQELAASVERCGARVASIVPTHVASWRCAARLRPDTARGTVALLEVSAAETRVTIVKDGNIRLVRELPFGSGNVTEALVGIVASERGEVTIDYSKAEALKRRYGVLTERAAGSTEEGVPLFHLSSLMRPALESLLTELSRVFSFYKVQIDEAGVDRILLCGGGANLKQLPPYLADGLGIPAELFNPLVNLGIASGTLDQAQIDEDGPRLVTALGAALEHGGRLNLLPAQMRRIRGGGVPQGLFARVVGGLAIGAVILAAALGVWLGVLHAQVRVHDRAWAALAPAYGEASRLVVDARRIRAASSQLDRFSAQQPLWAGLFKELAVLTPPTVTLQAVTVDAGTTIDLTGHVSAADREGQGTIARFMSALQDSPFFTHLTLISSDVQSADGGHIRFQLKGQLE